MRFTVRRKYSRYGRKRSFVKSYSVSKSTPRFRTYSRFRPSFSRRSFRSKRGYRWYYATVDSEQGASRVKLPRFGYVKVVNKRNGREFFVHETKAGAYDAEPYQRILYNAASFAQRNVRFLSPIS